MPRDIHQVIMKFDNYTENVDKILTQIESLDDTSINSIKQEGKWTLGQICHHLYTAQVGTYGYIRKRLEANKVTKPTDFGNFARNTLLVIALKLPIKYKAPAVIANVPDTVQINTLTKDWKENNDAFRELIRNLPQNLADKEIFKHPVGGMFNIDQTINFMQEHFNHHLPQIKAAM